MRGLRWVGLLFLGVWGALACGDADNGNAVPSESTNGAAGASSSPPGTGSGSGGAAGAATCGPLPEPGAVLDGDLSLLTPDDVANAQQYSEVTGNLAVSPSLQVVELPNLVAIGGAIHFESLSLTHLALSNLRTLGGELWLYLNLELLEADFRSLEEVGGRVYIHRNIALHSIQLFSLISIGGMPVSGPVPMEFSAQLALPNCFEDRLIELIPNLSLIGSDVQCACVLECDLLVADC